MEYYSAIRKNVKNDILPFATTWVDLEGIKLSEISHTERQIPHDIMISLICGIPPRKTPKQMNKQNKPETYP